MGIVWQAASCCRVRGAHWSLEGGRADIEAATSSGRQQGAWLLLLTELLRGLLLGKLELLLLLGSQVVHVVHKLRGLGSIRYRRVLTLLLGSRDEDLGLGDLL